MQLLKLVILTKIDQKSKQNFILSPRFPPQSCRSLRDLQLSLGNLGLRMKFCLDFWSIFVQDFEILKVNHE